MKTIKKCQKAKEMLLILWILLDHLILRLVQVLLIVNEQKLTLYTYIRDKFRVRKSFVDSLVF